MMHENEKKLVLVEATKPTYYHRTRRPGDQFEMTRAYAEWFVKKGIVKLVTGGARALVPDVPAGGDELGAKRVRRRSLTSAEIENRALRTE